MSRGRRSFLLGLLIITATVCLVLGLTLPIIKLTRFYVWSDVHSLVTVVRELYYSDEIILAGIVFVFSIVFPFFKLLYLLTLYTILTVHPDDPGPWLKRISLAGKWSMLDVLVLALIIFYAKMTDLADAVSLPGIYFFAVAVILTMIATAWLESIVTQVRSEAEKNDAKQIEPDGPVFGEDASK